MAHSYAHRIHFTLENWVVSRAKGTKLDLFRVLYSMVLLNALAGLLLAQTPATPAELNIGDPAPKLVLEGWVKGDPTSDYKKGHTYVVEFWATWCGPCIASFPHLSDMADKMAGKATFISINTWDYRGKKPGEFEEMAAHRERVIKFIQENDQKMRYTIALDDKNDTMAKTWMTAAGRNGIPCAFIVDGEGRVAWVGHPMQMDQPLQQIVEGKYDLAGFKKTFDESRAKQKIAAAKRAEITKAAKANDMAAFDKAMKDMSANEAVQTAMTANPDFGMAVMEKYAGQIKEVPAYGWCSMAGYIAQNTKSADVKARAVKFSEDCYGKVSEGEAALGAIYHARVLFNAGKVDEAKKWAEKAKGMVDKFEPATQRPGIKKFIDDVTASFGS